PPTTDLSTLPLHDALPIWKSNGLNGALALATGEIVIRLDADTFVSETHGFAPIVRHFADPEVGGVQGAIHPRQRGGWIAPWTPRTGEHTAELPSPTKLPIP